MKLQEIESKNLTVELDILGKDVELCKQVQIRLVDLFLLPANGIDGIYGSQTKKAFEVFKKIFNQANVDVIGGGSAKLLIETKQMPEGLTLQAIVSKELTFPIDYLKQDTILCKEIQTKLAGLGLLPPSGIDGIFGNRTKTAFVVFKKTLEQVNPEWIGGGSAKLLLETFKLPSISSNPTSTTKLIITASQVESVYGRSITLAQLNDLNECLRTFSIDKKQRIRHFVSQTAHESGGLKWLKELASGQAYEGRKDLGNVYPGDGPRYKGAGVLQMTGRNNYTAFANYIRDPKVMDGVDYVALRYPFTSAGYWWYRNGMNNLCDKGSSVREITRRVNGGYNGLADRERYYALACKYI